MYSAEEATQQILDWIDRRSGDDPCSSADDDDLDELYDSDDQPDDLFNRENSLESDDVEETEEETGNAIPTANEDHDHDLSDDEPQSPRPSKRSSQARPSDTGEDAENEEAAITNARGRLPYRRKLLIRKRIVHDLESALDEDNYDDIRYRNKRYAGKLLSDISVLQN